MTRRTALRNALERIVTQDDNDKIILLTEDDKVENLRAKWRRELKETTQ
mgnify:CR=1 FL=1|jgi:mannose/fructose-specific phosphotransferase system component IIA